MTKTQAIRRRLGGSANLIEPFPEKPARMHWRTYDRLHRQAREAEFRYDREFWMRMQQWNALLGRPLDMPVVDNLDTLLDELLGSSARGEQADER